MGNKRTTAQRTMVYMYMLEHGSITRRQARAFGCERLAARIADLKKRGARINSELINVTNADGSTSRIARYSIIKEGDRH